VKATDLKIKAIGHVVGNTKTWEHFNHSKLVLRAGLFIVGDQGSYYNVVTALNYMPR
jgi:hypothetical protein